jgi:hypothetical protein
VGWSVFPWLPADPEAVSYEEVLRLADRALYRAKEAGRDQSVGLIPGSRFIAAPSDRIEDVDGKTVRVVSSTATVP